MAPDGCSHAQDVKVKISIVPTVTVETEVPAKGRSPGSDGAVNSIPSKERRNMKIGVASYNGKIISKHFGRSRYFVIFDIEDGKVIGRENRENTFTAHARGECHDGQHEQGAGHGHHSHAGIVNALYDCEAVLCYGMGWRAAEDLKAAGIKACILTEDCTMEQAVQAYIDGKLQPSEEAYCRCHESNESAKSN
jgi:predicted Fe-Mo cluster-binding NifX family protein